MSSEKRTIKINPELFKTSDKNISRKKREKSDLKIKVKSERNHKNKSLRRSVMKMIREKQQEEYKKLFSNSEKEKETKDESSGFHKDFEDSLEYFNSLVEREKEKEKENLKNTTLKNYNEHPTEYMNTPIHYELPNVLNNIDLKPSESSIQIHSNQPSLLHQPPKYGCLKNGVLPTYRTYYNKTRRNNDPDIHLQQVSQRPPIHQEPPSPISQVPVQPLTLNTDENNIKNTLSEKRQKFQKETMEQGGNKKYLKYLKRRKIYKRTYKIGRSQTKPQISVLVSNKTIRNRISTEAQQLKQTPIQDVKQYLVKKGFIKVGSVTPNDVLRKMYESVSLICGEVQNHNPENLLYNFMNDTSHK
jgi:hypothetical protein